MYIMLFKEALEQIIGLCPDGYEPLAYIVVAWFALFIIMNAFMLIGAIIKKVGDL